MEYVVRQCTAGEAVLRRYQKTRHTYQNQNGSEDGRRCAVNAFLIDRLAHLRRRIPRADKIRQAVQRGDRLSMSFPPGRLRGDLHMTAGVARGQNCRAGLFDVPEFFCQHLL